MNNCPFCGSNNVKFDRIDLSRHFCEDCGAQGPGVELPMKLLVDNQEIRIREEESLRLWNRRAGEMNEERAREILGDIVGSSEGRNDLFRLQNWKGEDIHVSLMLSRGEENPTLFGEFSADQLEAIAWWVRNKAKP